MKEQSLKKNMIFSTIYQMILLITPLITTPYISRVLGPQGNGIYSYTNSYQIYFSMFAALGTVSYGRREIARNRDNVALRSKLFWEIELLTCITTVVCIVAWGCFVSLQNSYKIIYMVLTLNLLTTMFDISWFYAGLEQFKYTVIINTVFRILGVVAQLLLINDKKDVVLYVLILSLSTLLGTISMWIALPKFLVRISIADLKVKVHFKETLIYFIPTIATTIYTVMDKSLIGVITKDPKENGYYEQANKVITLMKSLTFTALNSVLGSRISYLFATEKYDEIKRHIAQSIDYILFMGIGMCMGLIAIADSFVPWFFGEQFEPVIPLLRIFAPIVIIIGISNCLGSQYYTPVGLRKKSSKYIIIGAVANLSMNLILIPQYAARGAAIASVLAELIITILYMKNCNGYITMKILYYKGWKKVVASIPMALIVYTLGRAQIANTTLVCAQLFGGSIIYIVLLIVMKDEFVLIWITKIGRKYKKSIYKR